MGIKKSQAMRLRQIIELAMNCEVDDITALEAVTLHPKWATGVNYEVGYRVQYNDILYVVITTHISQETWTPDVAPSLFAKVLIPDENVIPAWEQPDSTNGYELGDKVTHNGKVWVSIYDGSNVWEPGVYGWEEYVEDSSEFNDTNSDNPIEDSNTGSEEAIPNWVQPDSTNPYSKGDKVIHNGETWASDIDGNVWEPGVYGWSEI